MTPETHREILSFPAEVSHGEVARQLGIGATTVRTWRVRPYPHHEYYDKSRRLHPDLDLPKDPEPSRFRFEPPPPPERIGVTADEKPDLNRILGRWIEDYRDTSDKEVRKNNQTITHAHGPVCYFLFGDVHFGSKGTDVKRAFDLLHRVKNTPGARIGFLGDLVDNFIVGALRSVRFGTQSSIPDEWYVAEHWLREASPVLDFVVGGNHDAWSMLMTGVDQLRQIMPAGIIYDKDEVKVTICVGGKSYRVWARHQFRGSSMYNPTHAEERAARFDNSDFDFYVSGHTHPGAVARSFVLKSEKKLALKVSAFKKIDDYQKRIGFPHNDGSDVAAILLRDDGRWTAFDDSEAAFEFLNAVYGRRAA